MKNSTLSIILLILLTSASCKKNGNEDIQFVPNTEQQLNNGFAALLSESGVNDLVTHPEGKTWRSVDQAYRREKSKFTRPRELQMFRTKMLHHLVVDFKITAEKDDAVLPVLEFWANEMKEMTSVHPYLAYLILERLDGFMAGDAIRQYAENYYLKAFAMKEKTFSQENLETGETLLNGIFKEDLHRLFQEYEVGLKNLAMLIQRKN